MSLKKLVAFSISSLSIAGFALFHYQNSLTELFHFRTDTKIHRFTSLLPFSKLRSIVRSKQLILKTKLNNVNDTIASEGKLTLNLNIEDEIEDIFETFEYEENLQASKGMPASLFIFEKYLDTSLRFLNSCLVLDKLNLHAMTPTTKQRIAELADRIANTTQDNDNFNLLAKRLKDNLTEPTVLFDDHLLRLSHVEDADFDVIFIQGLKVFY